MPATQRVLMVAPSYVPFLGGAQRFQHAMATRLLNDGHRVTVLTSDAYQPSDFWRPRTKDDPRLAGRETVDSVPIQRLGLRYPWPAPYAFGGLRRLGHLLCRSGVPAALQMPALQALARHMPPLAELQPTLDRLVEQSSLVQATDASWDGLFVAACRAAQRYGRPFVAVPLMHLGDDRVRAHFGMAHQLQAYRQADAVLALSDAEALALGELGVPEKRVHVIAMGIDATPPPAPSEVAAFRAKHGLCAPTIAFLGANTRDKGAFDLIDALLRLLRQGVEADMVCAGPQSELLRAHLNALPLDARQALASHLHILGVIDEPEKTALLAACSLLALPSQVDTFGIVVLEAWAQGKPVIGARAGGLPDLIAEGETGLLVPFGDSRALADAIARLLTDPSLASRLGLAGQRQTLTRFSWDVTYRTLSRIYASLAHGDAPAARVEG